MVCSSEATGHSEIIIIDWVMPILSNTWGEFCGKNKKWQEIQT